MIKDENVTSFTELTSSEKLNHQRAYELISVDLLEIFTYIEPHCSNGNAYGHQIYQLYLRICTEFEAACRLALRRLGEVKRKKKNGDEIDWKISDYAKLNKAGGCWDRSSCQLTPTGSLADYQFVFLEWCEKITPLHSFSHESSKSPKFYQSYNSVKHDRLENFKEANLNNLLNAFSALVAVLDWQGISVDHNVLANCSNEVITGSKFGYFFINTDEIKSRVYI